MMLFVIPNEVRNQESLTDAQTVRLRGGVGTALSE